MGVHVERRDAVVVVTIDRQETRNAVDAPTATALFEAFSSLDGDDAVRAAVLYGAGGTFCSGADLKAIAAGDGLELSQERGPLGPTRLRGAVPVVAAIEGYAVAGGLELALWCDLRVAAEDAVLGVLNRRWGVPLMDGGTVRLPRLIGQGRALDLILTGRAVGGREAFDIGLVDRLAPRERVLDAALELAAAIASFPPMTLREDRSSIYEQWGLDEEAALANEHRHGLASLASGEAVAGARRFAAGTGRHGDFGSD